MSDSEHAALIALLRERPGGLAWPALAAEVVEAGSAVTVWERLVPATLFGVPGEVPPSDAAAADIAEWEREGLRLLSVLDADYPARLRGIHQVPPILFARGTVLPDDAAVSVVGSREASDDGLHLAGEVSRALVYEGLTVLSGLAAGIDAAAHRAALDAGGRTVAVLGTGIRRYYPAAHQDLQEAIAERGLVLSQSWPDAPPQRHSFPMRNATMSGYGLATVVVEAGEHSGARIQARVAVEHGRPVLLTDTVVDRNAWARALVDRPGVHVVSQPGQVVTLARQLLAERTRVQGMLRDLVPA